MPPGNNSNQNNNQQGSGQQQGQQPQQQNPFPHIALPGMDPSPNPKVVVKSINPPITPDQVVSMAEAPSAVQLPEIKLQNIKIPPVKNKTIQGHLKAIEAKMIATEKLMKDIVKLQKVQIHTEKELHERRRELYQNTFEEYLLDKTIDFEDPDDPDCTCINLPKKPPGGAPGFKGNRRNRQRDPVNVPTTVPSTVPSNAPKTVPSQTPEPVKPPVTPKEPFRWPQIPVIPPFPIPMPEDLLPPVIGAKPKQPAYTIAGAPELSSILSSGISTSLQPQAPSLAFSTPAQLTTEELIAQLNAELLGPQTTYGGSFDVAQASSTGPKGLSTKNGDSIDAIYEEWSKNYKPAVPDVYNFPQDTNENEIAFLKGLGLTEEQAQFAVTAIEIGTIFLPGPGKGAGIAKLKNLLNPKNLNLLNKLRNLGRRPVTPTTPVTPQPALPAAVNSIKPLPRPLNVPNQVSGQTVNVKPTSTQTTTKVGEGITEIVGESMGRGARNPIKKTGSTTVDTSKIRESPTGTVYQRGNINADEASKLYRASGGINDLNLYSAESQEYFRNLSSNMEIPKFGIGGIIQGVKNFFTPQGLARGLKGVQAGFTGMGKTGFDAMMRGEGYKASSKPQILGRGAYSAPTLGGAQRYAGATGSLGGRQIPGGVVNSIVPGNAPRINFIEPQSKVTAEMFNKGRDLATKLQGGAYPNSARANMLRSQITTGGARSGGIKPGNPVVMLIQAIAEELINPRPAGMYDQISGPNAYYNAPGYKGPKPSGALENAQDNMRSGSNNNTPEIVPLPPDYIKLPSRSKQKEEVGEEVPGIDMPSSIFSRSSIYLD